MDATKGPNQDKKKDGWETEAGIKTCSHTNTHLPKVVRSSGGMGGGGDGVGYGMG